jgi:hypothetical protein
VFGVLEGMTMLALAIGSIGAAALVAGLGIRTALIVTGAFVPAAMLLALRRLLAIDAAAKAPDPVVLALLQRIPIFSPLPAPGMERIMADLTKVVVEAGEIVIRQGESGDRFYVIAEGEAQVIIDDRREARFGPGDWFGEIALLRDVPRTATVRALTPMTLYALERAPFLEAVTGHPRSVQLADEIVRARLGG